MQGRNGPTRSNIPMRPPAQVPSPPTSNPAGLAALSDAQLAGLEDLLEEGF